MFVRGNRYVIVTTSLTSQKHCMKHDKKFTCRTPTVNHLGLRNRRDAKKLRWCDQRKVVTIYTYLQRNILIDKQISATTGWDWAWTKRTTAGDRQRTKWIVNVQPSLSGNWRTFDDASMSRHPVVDSRLTHCTVMSTTHVNDSAITPASAHLQ